MPPFSLKLLQNLRTHLHLLPAPPPPPPPLSTTPSPMITLPHEFVISIGELLPPASLNSLIRTSRHFHQTLTPLLHKYVLHSWHDPTPLFPTPPLLYAALHGYTGLVRIVLDNQHLPGIAPHLEARCPAGSTALHWATRYNNENMVQLLLDGGADVNAPDNTFGETPLHSAARLGYLGITRMLLQHGANIEQESLARVTPLEEAVKRGQTGAVELLLESGAAVPGGKVLHSAVESGSLELVKMLLGQPGVDVDARAVGGKTPLHYAVVRSREAMEMAKMLVEMGADVDAVDGEGRNAVYYALGELLKEYRYKDSVASTRKKREAVLRYLVEEKPFVGGEATALLDECKKEVRRFSRFRVTLGRVVLREEEGGNRAELVGLYGRRRRLDEPSSRVRENRRVFN